MTARAASIWFDVELSVQVCGTLRIQAASLEEAEEIADNLGEPDADVRFSGHGELDAPTSDLCVYGVAPTKLSEGLERPPARCPEAESKPVRQIVVEHE